MYDGDTADIEGDWETKRSKGSKGKSKRPSTKSKMESMYGACGSTSHKHSTHKDCPFNTCKHGSVKKSEEVDVAVVSPLQSSDAMSAVCSVRDAVSKTESLDSDGVVFDLCMCGGAIGPTRGAVL